MTPPRPRIVKPRLVWRLVGCNWTPFHRVTWTEGTKRRAREIKLDWKGDPRELDRLYWLAQAGQHKAQEKPAPGLEPGWPKPRDFKSCGFDTFQWVSRSVTTGHRANV